MDELYDCFPIGERSNWDHLTLVEEEPMAFESMLFGPNRKKIDRSIADCYRTHIYTIPLLKVPPESATIPVGRLVDKNGHVRYSVFTSEALLHEWIRQVNSPNPWNGQVVDVLTALPDKESYANIWYEAVSRVSYDYVVEKYHQKMAGKDKVDRQKLDPNKKYFWDLTVEEYADKLRKSGDLHPKSIAGRTHSIIEDFLDGAFFRGFIAIKCHPVEGESYWLSEIQYQGHGYSPMRLVGRGGIDFYHGNVLLYHLFTWMR